VPFYNNARKKNRRRLHIRILNGEQKNADPEYDTTLNSSHKNHAGDDNKYLNTKFMVRLADEYRRGFSKSVTIFSIDLVRRF